MIDKKTFELIKISMIFSTLFEICGELNIEVDQYFLHSALNQYVVYGTYVTEEDVKNIKAFIDNMHYEEESK